MMRIDPVNGKKAKSVFDVTEKFSGYTALTCRPVTERTHQLRIHLKHAGFPIIGDKLYGGKPLWLSRLKKDFRLKRGREERPLIARVALHAQELSLPHPITNEPVTISAELPKDLRVALRYLREFRGTGSPE
jgi:23S rRNA-/tRNA-specific pseudouridylate synthase